MVQWVQKNARKRAVQTSIFCGLFAGVIGNRRLDVLGVGYSGRHTMVVTRSRLADDGYHEPSSDLTPNHSGAGPLLSRSIS